MFFNCIFTFILKRPISIFNFSIQNASNDSVDIHIDGEIVDASTQEIYRSWLGDDTSVSFKSFRNSINSQPAKVYNVYINSGGGLLTDAMAMHDFLKELQDQGKTVNTIGRGIVASAATFVLMAGRDAKMSKNSWFMIHNVSGGIWGTVDEVESYASTLRKFNDRARDFYAEYTTMRKEDIAKLMNAEFWMTADDAKSKGFIKEVTSDISPTNSISPDMWNRVGFSNMSVLQAYNSSVSAPPDNSILTEFKNFTNDMKVSFKSIMDALKGAKPTNADATSIVNAIADVLAPAFAEQATDIENAINNEMAEKVNEITKNVTDSVTKTVTADVTKSVTDSVTTSFETRIKNLEDKNAELESTNKELEKEITNSKGGESTSKEKNDVKIIGQGTKVKTNQ